MMKPSLLAPLALVLLLVPVPVLAQSPPDELRNRLTTFVNAGESSPNLRADRVRAPGTAFPLRAPTVPFSVTYTHDGRTYTLEDYLHRGDVLGFLILKGDEIIFEDYRHGTGPGDRYLSYSVSKSIVSTLVGIAVDEGHIASVEDPVTRYLPFLERSGFAASTVRECSTWRRTSTSARSTATRPPASPHCTARGGTAIRPSPSTC
jgi:CubicO group peptidase (beta-lactamase class C family)